MVLKHFQDKTAAAARAEKEEEQRLRKVASFVAKEIRTFWANVEKVHFSNSFSLFSKCEISTPIVPLFRVLGAINLEQQHRIYCVDACKIKPRC